MFLPNPIAPIAFSVVNEKSHQSEQIARAYHVDVFPDRLTLFNPDDLHEMALLIAQTRLTPQAADVFAGRNALTEGFDTPLGRVHADAATWSTRGQVRPSTIRVTDTDVILPDGRQIAISAFPADPVVTEQTFEYRRGLLETLPENLPRQITTQIGIGALRSVLPIPAKSYDIGTRLGAVLGRLAVHARINDKSGREAVDLARGHGPHILQHLRRALLLAPDRWFGPSTFTTTPEFEALVPRCNPDLLHLGAELMALVPVGLDATRQGRFISGALEDLKPHCTAHEIVKLIQTRARFDETVEALTPLELLKHPMKRRQQRLRQADEPIS